MWGWRGRGLGSAMRTVIYDLDHHRDGIESPGGGGTGTHARRSVNVAQTPQERRLKDAWGTRRAARGCALKAPC